MTNKYYVYGHCLPGETTYFYIGQGKGRRAYNKSKKDRSNLWKNFVNGRKYEVHIIQGGLTREESWELERSIICFYGRKNTFSGCLVNDSDGGERNIGGMPSEEKRKSHSLLMSGEKQRGERNPMWGRTGANSPRSKKVLCVETGVIFDSAKLAAEHCGVTRCCIQDCCNGRQKTSGGFHWQYLNKQGEL